MLEDRYGNPLSTRSVAACEAYVDGVDRFLAAVEGVDEAFDSAIAADPHFALAHVGLARSRQVCGDGAGAARAISAARDLVDASTHREARHIEIFDVLIAGDSDAAYEAIRAHLAEYPRDAMVAQTCAGVFGLIGFSGRPGREAEQLAFTTALLPHYGDDWWFLGQHAFAQVETGQVGPATETIERSLAGNPRSAHGAHNRAHIYYEAGETEEGYDFLARWRRGYDRGGALHCHVSWHLALWALERGDFEAMWDVIDSDVAPGATDGPPLNVLTDNAAILYRAELAGVEIPRDRWTAVSDYAARNFPNPGIAFADIHGALAHAMAGNREGLDRIISGARGPAADMVRAIAKAFDAISEGKWAAASDCLTSIMSAQERIGGSRAQRDLLEYALQSTLAKQGRVAEARLLLATRRPQKAQARAVIGL